MPERRQNRVQKLVAAGVVGVLALVLIGWIGSVIFRSARKPAPGANITGAASAGAPAAAVQAFAGYAPANVRPAVLYECYDHYRENVPPRNDTSARQRNWRPPPMPLELIRSAVAGQPEDAREQELLNWFESWDAGYRSGAETTRETWTRLESLVYESRLPFDVLFSVGAAMGFLENDRVATMFYRAALSRAEAEYKDLSPVHPAAPMLRVALPQMGMLWRTNGYEALERRFRLESQVHPPLSQESRKCAHSCAEAQFYQGNNKEAADLITTVMQRHEQAGDLTESDRYEMGWILGLFYSSAGRYKEAAPELAIACKPGGYHARSAPVLLANCLAMLPPEEAEAIVKSVEGKLTAQQMEMIRADTDARRIRIQQRQRPQQGSN